MSIPGVGLLTATGDRGRHRWQRRPLQERAPLRLLVRPHAQGELFGWHAPPGAHLQDGRHLLAHAAHSRSALGDPRGHGGKTQRPRARSGCATGRCSCRRAPITTRPPARWPTRWRASATRCCATKRPLVNRRLGLARRCSASPLSWRTDQPFPTRVASRRFDPSWQHRSHHNPTMPITLPAHRPTGTQPLAAIGTGLADSMSARATTHSAHSRCRIYDCKRFRSPSTSNSSCPWEGVHIRG